MICHGQFQSYSSFAEYWTYWKSDHRKNEPDHDQFILQKNEPDSDQRVI